MTIRYISVSHFAARKANSLQIVAMCNAFAEREETHLYFFDDDGSEEEVLRKVFRLHPRVHCMPVRRKRFPVLPRLLNLLRMTRLAARDGGPTGFIYTREMLAAFFLAFSGPRFFLEHHLDLPVRFRPQLLTIITRCRRFAAHVPISAFLIDALGLGRFPASKVLVLHDGADLSLFDARLPKSEARARFSLPPGRFIAGYAGQLFPEKGVWFILDLAEAMPETEFLLVGGEEKDLLKMKAAVAGRGLGNVRLAGRVDHAAVPAWLAACDCFLLPNIVNFYMSPLKLFEYMASRRPVLASDLPPFREVVDDGVTGLLAAPGSVPAFTAALESLRSDPDLAERLSLAARDKVEKEYSWSARADRIIAARAASRVSDGK